jgi:hypothetical protein
MNHVIRFLWLLTPALLAGCGSSPEQQPPPSFSRDSLIGETLMVQILADVHEIEAGIQVLRNQGKDPGPLTAELYDGLFRKYHISESRFRDNLSYYRTDPEHYLKLYEQVLKELKDRQTRFRLPGNKPSASG